MFHLLWLHFADCIQSPFFAVSDLSRPVIPGYFACVAFASQTSLAQTLLSCHSTELRPQENNYLVIPFEMGVGQLKENEIFSILSCVYSSPCSHQNI